MSFSHAIPFSSGQLQTLAAWSDTRRYGFEVRIVTDHAELEEVAELFRSGQEQPLYRITAISTGEFDIYDSEGIRDVADGLDAALAWVASHESAKGAVLA